MLRRVVAAKAAAVASEDFAAAKRLKSVQDSIRAVGGSLAVLMSDKAKAIRVRQGCGFLCVCLGVCARLL